MDDASASPAPLCQNCGGPMVIRESNGNHFYGCLRFPDCRGTRSLEGHARPKITDQWRDETARMILLALIGNWRAVFKPSDPRSASQEAVQICDELIEELRK